MVDVKAYPNLGIDYIKKGVKFSVNRGANSLNIRNSLSLKLFLI